MMELDYEQRVQVIRGWLSPQSGFLCRRKEPDMADAAIIEEANRIVEAINEALPPKVSKERLGVILANMAKELDRTSRSRAWPLIAHFADAARQCSAEGGAATEADLEDRMVSALTAWFRKHGDCLPACGSESRTAEMVRRGVLTWEEARTKGFPIPDEQRRRIVGKAMSQRQLAAERTVEPGAQF